MAGQVIERIDAHPKAELRSVRLEGRHRPFEQREPIQGRHDPIRCRPRQRAFRHKLQDGPARNEGVVERRGCKSGPMVKTTHDGVPIETA